MELKSMIYMNVSRAPVFIFTKKINIFILIFGIILFSYTCLRAYLLSFTWDESYTFLEFVHGPSWMPSSYSKMSANNHLLNTWLMKISSSIFGPWEFSLRLANVFSHLLFLFFSAKIVKQFQSKMMVICAFLIINLCPYLLDFFSLARGYGLSMGLLMGSIYFLYAWLKNGLKQRHALYSQLFAAFALMANSSMLHYLLALTITMLAIQIIHERKNYRSPGFRTFIKNVFPLGLIPCFFIAQILPMLFKMKNAGAFFYGGESIMDTMNSFKWMILYDKIYPHFINMAIKIFLLTITLLSTFYFSKSLKERTLTAREYFLISLIAIIILSIVINITEHYFLGIKFLTDRTALFLIPICLLVLVILLENFSMQFKTGKFFMLTLCGLSLLHFVSCMNFTYAASWQNNADIKTVVNYIKTQHDQESPMSANVLIVVDSDFDPSMNYYRSIYKLDWLRVVTESEVHDSSNVYYFLKQSSSMALNQKETICVKKYPFTNNMLFRRKNFQP